MKHILITTLALGFLGGIVDAQTLNSSSSGGSNQGVGGLSSNELPDLAITPMYKGTGGKPKTGYCGPLKNGKAQYALVVTNIGDSDSPPARYNIYAPGFVALGINGVPTVPSLKPGQKHQIISTIPDAWIAAGTPGETSFSMEVNGQKKFSEKTLKNNMRKATCLGGKAQS